MTSDDSMPANHDAATALPRRTKRRLLVGTALCSTFLLVHCAKPTRDFDKILPATGGRKGTGGGEPLGGDTGAGGGNGPGGFGGTDESGGATSGGGSESGGSESGGSESGGSESGGSESGGAPSGGAAAGGNGSGGSPPCDDNSDPDCRCVDGLLEAKDIDQDGEGTRLCEAAPGIDCDDGDENFVRNECGGCIKDLGGAVNDACGDCGILKCQGDSALVCKSPVPQPKRCTDANTPQACVNGNWVVQSDCSGGTPVCLGGSCVQCNPGAPTNPIAGQNARQYKCEPIGNDSVLYRCADTGSWESSWILSCYASSLQVCDAATASCVTAGIRHLRDESFEVVPPLLKGLERSRGGRPVLEVFDSLLGSKFG